MKYDCYYCTRNFYCNKNVCEKEIEEKQKQKQKHKHKHEFKL